MKTSHIIGITAGSIVGALLLGGGAFAAGINLGNDDGFHQMVQQRVEQRSLERDHDRERAREHRGEEYGSRPFDQREPRHGKGIHERSGHNVEHGGPNTEQPGPRPIEPEPLAPDLSIDDELSPLS